MKDMTVEDLKVMKIWFLWNYSPGKNGKMTKVPFSTYGGETGTDEAHKDTWATYDEVLKDNENIRILRIDLAGYRS